MGPTCTTLPMLQLLLLLCVLQLLRKLFHSVFARYLCSFPLRLPWLYYKFTTMYPGLPYLYNAYLCCTMLSLCFTALCYAVTVVNFSKGTSCTQHCCPWTSQALLPPSACSASLCSLTPQRPAFWFSCRSSV